MIQLLLLQVWNGLILWTVYTRQLNCLCCVFCTFESEDYNQIMDYFTADLKDNNCYFFKFEMDLYCGLFTTAS